MDRGRYDDTLATVRAALGDAVFATWREDGRAFPLERAVAEILAWGEDAGTPVPSPPTEPVARAAADRGVATLSRRERDIVRLIAAGRTNRQLAAELGITERTAATHVGNILKKLGVATRAEIAAWAARQNDPEIVAR